MAGDIVIRQGLPENVDKTWFSIDGTLETIDFDGPSFFRFPIELAKFVLDRFCPPGGSVFDPFVGFGTTLVAAQETGRWGVGFEQDKTRMMYASKRVRSPTRIIHDGIQNANQHSLPEFDLIFTSPPYASFSGPQNDPSETYIKDLENIFSSFKSLMKADARLVVEISNVKDNRGIVPLAFMATSALMKHYQFEGELVRCNTGNELAGPGYCHSYLLVFRKFESERMYT